MRKKVTILLVCLAATVGLRAQEQTELTSEGYLSYQGVGFVTTPPEYRQGTDSNPTMDAVRISSNNEVRLDGFLDEAAWKTAPIATGFTQRFPEDGGKPSQRTEARILYTDSHIFVGIMAYETNPDSINNPLFRRDSDENSDWVYVAFDSYNDKRTAFGFGVNPRGVQRDVLLFDDTSEDELWNAVWEAEAKITNEGWSVEMKIPLSQLRFSSNNAVHSWGINFVRSIARTNEDDYWSPTLQRESGVVSKFGRLNGIRDLQEPRRLEISPYISSSLTRAPKPGNNDPYYSANEFAGNMGGDIKYGLTSDLTLTATINPDFGQVEADPAVINLSQFENYFEERRPFFLEGNDIFRFGRTRTYNSIGNPETFYSRRIGRAPQGNVFVYNDYKNGAVFDGNNLNSMYTDAPAQTSIAAAAKISGKTQKGWSIGFINALTTQENGEFTAINEHNDATTGDYVAEPLSNYLVTRVKKDVNQGNTVVGGFISAVNRNIEGTYFETYQRKSAYLTGADFEHNWKDREYVVSGTISYSQINGTTDVIKNAQNAPQRYYQRVDSDGLNVDASKTSLDGFASEFSLRKSAGDHFTGSVTYSDVSPGYETNDIGFQNRADYRATAFAFQWQETDPKKAQYWELWSYHLYGWNYDGDTIWRNINFGGFIRFNNQWHFNANVNGSFDRVSDRLTRGGPLMKYNDDLNFNFNVGSNQAKNIAGGFGQFHRRDILDEYDDYYWVWVNLRPATNIQIYIEPEVGFELDQDQFVDIIDRNPGDADAEQTYGKRYIFADSRSTNISTIFRVNWTFNPRMSLQTFVRPLIGSYRFSNFGEFNDPGGFGFDRYGEDEGELTETGNGEYSVDLDGDSQEDFRFNRSDFTYRALQGNAVFRWEYRPGSVLFLVWQQQRDGEIGEGVFNFGRDFVDIFDPKPTNIFLVKLSYWFGT